MRSKAMKRGLKLVLAFLLVITACNEVKKTTNTLSQLLNEQDVDVNTLEILIDKGNYQLSIISAGQTIKQYPIVLGGNPVDDKRCEGDKCTPEGVFGVRDMYPHKKWSKFIWIDYPNEESWKKHLTSKQAGEIPGTATIGGEVGIHGVPEGCDYLIEEKTNWTLGCISMKNADINEIYPYINKNTKITIIH